MFRQNNSIDLSSINHKPFLDIFVDDESKKKGNYNNFYDNFLDSFNNVTSNFSFKLTNDINNIIIADDTPDSIGGNNEWD